MNTDRLFALYERVVDTPDAVDRLRRFVLDLAVQGKLVAQDPADEPVSELVKRIENGKVRLALPKRARKPRPLPAVDGKQAPFELPSTWRWVYFGNIVEFAAGRTPPRKEVAYWNTGDFPWVCIADMADGETVRFTKESVSVEARHNVFKREPVPAGTMIMSFKLTIGKIARLGVPAFHNEAIISIWPRVAELDPFLFRVLPDLARSATAKGAVKGATLNRQSLSRILVPLPPLPEQRRIVAKVDELMKLCDRLDETRGARDDTRDRFTKASYARLTEPDTDERTFRSHARFAVDALPALTAQRDQVKHLRHTILSLAVRGKLVEQDRGLTPVATLLANRGIQVSGSRWFEIPKTWGWVRVRAVAESRLGKMLDKSKNTGKPRRYLRNVNVRWFDFDLSNVLEMRFEDVELPKFALRTGDVLICEGGEPGRAAVWDERDDEIYFQKAIHRVRFLDIVDGQYFVKALRASADEGRLAEYFTGTTFKHFTGTALRAYVFPLPPLAEQHRIVAKVDQLMALCDQIETGLGVVDDTRSRLLESILHDGLGSAQPEWATDWHSGHDVRGPRVDGPRTPRQRHLNPGASDSDPLTTLTQA